MCGSLCSVQHIHSLQVRLPKIIDRWWHVFVEQILQGQRPPLCKANIKEMSECHKERLDGMAADLEQAPSSTSVPSRALPREWEWEARVASRSPPQGSLSRPLPQNLRMIA